MELNVMDIFKLALFAHSASKDPEGAALKEIDKFKNNEKTPEIITGLRELMVKQYEVEDIRLAIVESNIKLSFHDTDMSFCEKFAGDILDIFEQVKPYLPEKFKGVYLDELEDNLTTISYKDRVASIEAPVPSERILNKLKEVLEEEQKDERLYQEDV